MVDDLARSESDTAGSGAGEVSGVKAALHEFAAHLRSAGITAIERAVGQPARATSHRPGEEIGEAVGPWSEASEDITMEPAVVTVSQSRRQQLLGQAGWRRVSLQFLLRSFDNELLRSHTCFLQFNGPRGETNTGRSDLTGGTASFPDFWLRPAGVLRLMAVPNADTSAEGGPLLEGTLPVPLRVASGYLAFTAVQDHEDIQVRASSQQAVAEEMQLHGDVKFSILGTAEVSGGVSSGTTTTRTATGEVTYIVRVGRAGLTIARADR